MHPPSYLADTLWVVGCAALAMFTLWEQVAYGHLMRSAALLAVWPVQMETSRLPPAFMALRVFPYAPERFIPASSLIPRPTSGAIGVDQVAEWLNGLMLEGSFAGKWRIHRTPAEVTLLFTASADKYAMGFGRLRITLLPGASRQIDHSGVQGPYRVQPTTSPAHTGEDCSINIHGTWGLPMYFMLAAGFAGLLLSLFSGIPWPLLFSGTFGALAYAPHYYRGRKVMEPLFAEIFARMAKSAP